MDATSSRAPRRWLQAPFSEFGARFSSSGRWVAYASNQTGALEVWVRPFPGPGAPLRISSEGGHDPVWSRDDKDVFYQNGSKLLSARVVADGTVLRAEAPHVLFEGGYVYDDDDPNLHFFDAAPDGRLLMIEPTDVAKPASIVAVQHWDQELNRLVPR